MHAKRRIGRQAERHTGKRTNIQTYKQQIDRKTNRQTYKETTDGQNRETPSFLDIFDFFGQGLQNCIKFNFIVIGGLEN